jgi:RNA polymerase sigma-54 factor
MKNALQLKMGQSLTMTPQLQQAIKLLQLHSLDLQQEIQNMLDSNPMLESEEDHQHEAASDTNATNDSNIESVDLSKDNAPEVEALPVDSVHEDSWEPMYGTATHSGEDQRDIWETQAGIPMDSLQDHLIWQLSFANLSNTDLEIAEAIVDAINDDGFLSEDFDTIYESLKQRIEDLEEDEVLAVLHRVQHLDPIGSGARSISECLCIQLNLLDKDTPGLKLAKQISEHSLDLLASHDYARLKRVHRTREEQLSTAISLIQSLNPKPGAMHTQQPVEYVVPDVFVSKHQNQWRVELNPDLTPKININQFYASMAEKTIAKEDSNYLKNNLQEAKWFLKSLHSRNDTILRVSQAIVRRQRAFFDYGEEAMKPMILRDIAEEVEMHESTISRVTNQKYMHTPRGVLELKYFFSSHVSTVDGGECSATAIRAIIKKLIAEEPLSKPLSDSKLATLLDEQGINVARRTVAKYREAMNIPPSNERKRLN